MGQRLKKTIEILLGSAFQSFFVALLLVVAIELTVSLGLSIFSQMTPDAPPGMALSSELSWPAQLKKYYDQHFFQFCWVSSFLALSSLNLTRDTKSRPLRRLRIRLRYLGKKLADKWFSILVGNAFACFFAAIFFSAMQQVSPARWLTDFVLTAVQPVAYRIAEFFFDASELGTAEAFLDWYHANEVKITFWFFYVSSLLDDFGLPNFKTLAKRVWLRYAQRTDSPRSESKPATGPPVPPPRESND